MLWTGSATRIKNAKKTGCLLTTCFSFRLFVIAVVAIFIVVGIVSVVQILIFFQIINVHLIGTVVVPIGVVITGGCVVLGTMLLVPLFSCFGFLSFFFSFLFFFLRFLFLLFFQFHSVLFASPIPFFHFCSVGFFVASAGSFFFVGHFPQGSD